ncbi:hypothetical protein EI555_021522, partial [Monodon monoceros]
EAIQDLVQENWKNKHPSCKLLINRLTKPQPQPNREYVRDVSWVYSSATRWGREVAGSGALCKGETHCKLKALRSGEEGAAVSERRLLSAQVSRLRSSGHNSCDALILWTCRESCFFAKGKRFLYFSGRRDEPSSVRFHCRLALITPILTPSSPNLILAQQRGRDRGRGARAHWISNSTKLSRSPRLSPDSVQAPLPASPPYSPRGPEERWPNFQVHYNPEIGLHRGLGVREVLILLGSSRLALGAAVRKVPAFFTVPGEGHSASGVITPSRYRVQRRRRAQVSLLRRRFQRGDAAISPGKEGGLPTGISPEFEKVQPAASGQKCALPGQWPGLPLLALSFLPRIAARTCLGAQWLGGRERPFPARRGP